LAHPKGAIGRHHPPNQELNMIDGYWNLAEDEEVGRVRAKLIICDECDDFAEVEVEDLTGYSRKPCDYLCARCYDARRDYPEPDRAWPQARNE
jgi:hypothetical protein